MSLSSLDQKLIDYRIIELSTKAATEIIARVMTDHIAACPIGKQLSTKVAFVSGIAAAIGIMSTLISIFVYFHKGG